MSEVISPIIFQLGVGGVGGFVVGFALKKLSKLVLILTGLFILALIYLSTRGIIDINYGSRGTGWQVYLAGAKRRARMAPFLCDYSAAATKTKIGA